MPSPLSADRPSAQPPGHGTIDALVSQTRRLKGAVDAIRRDTPDEGCDPWERRQRALNDLVRQHLDDPYPRPAQPRDEPSAPPGGNATGPPARHDTLPGRAGSGEWNLLTDEVSWSSGLYRLLGRDPATPPLTLDELPSLVLEADRPALTTMVTGCLVDARPIDGEFRILRRDDAVRTLHMRGEPVLAADGSVVSMWAVLRDISDLRLRRQHSANEAPDALHQQQRGTAGTGLGPAADVQEAVPPPWRGSLRLPRGGPRALDVAAAHLPPSAHAPARAGDWYDARDLPDGTMLLSAGDLTGRGVTAACDVAMLLGAVRGMAMTGTAPGPLLTRLNRLLDAAAQPVLCGAVCLGYRPATRSLVWAQAGHPAPLLFRGGTGRALEAPHGALLGAASGSRYRQAEVTLEVGDLVLLHTGGPAPGHAGSRAVHRLLGLSLFFGGARTAQDCIHAVVREFGNGEHEGHAGVLVARVVS